MEDEIREIIDMQNCPPFDTFDQNRLCPFCNSAAKWVTLILRHRTAGEVGHLMLRSCVNCGFQWMENMAK